MGKQNNQYVEALKENLRKLIEVKQDPEAIKMVEGIKNDRIKLQPWAVVSSVVADGTLVKMFEQSDLKKTGIKNLPSGKLQKNTYFFINAIQIVGVNTPNLAIDEAGLIATNFRALEDLPENGLRNGYFEFSLGNTKHISEMPFDVFFTKGQTDVPAGFWPLETPLLARPDDVFALDITLAKSPATAKDTAFKVILHGLSTISVG